MFDSIAVIGLMYVRTSDRVYCRSANDLYALHQCRASWTGDKAFAVLIAVMCAAAVIALAAFVMPGPDSGFDQARALIVFPRFTAISMDRENEVGHLPMDHRQAMPVAGPGIGSAVGPAGNKDHAAQFPDASRPMQCASAVCESDARDTDDRNALEETFNADTRQEAFLLDAEADAADIVPADATGRPASSFLP